MFRTRKTKKERVEKIITASVITDVGCVREENQDSGRHIIPGDKNLIKNRGSLTVVADGMGGHAAGEVASEMAVELIGEYYYQSSKGSPQEALKKAIELANREIFKKSIGDPDFFGMGTTVIALVILEDKAFSAHVGDSRLYQLSGNEMELLTIDHSQVMEMVKHGVISMDEAENHEDKNIILRALGTQGQVEVEISDFFPVKIDDEFLLCSDGLCDMLTDEEIGEIWFEAKDIYTASQKLIEESKNKGGEDNVTVGIVRVGAKSEMVTNGNIKKTRELKRLDK